MRLVLLGPPGAGKGTQAAILSEKLGVPHISTGDLFRANIGEGTPLGVEAKSYIDAGKLVPTDVTARMVEDRLNQDDAKDGFLLDGFPRTVEQAEILTELLAKRGEKLDGVLNFVVDEDVVIERMLARGRADDNEETIRTRLGVYREETAPLIEHYGDQIISIDAVGDVDIDAHHSVEDTAIVIGECLLAGCSAVMQLGYGLRPTCQRIEGRLGSLLLHGRRDGALEKLFGAVFGRLHVLRPHFQNILEICGGICERGLQHRDDITAMLVRATRSRTTSHRIWLQLGQLAIQTSDVVLDNVSKLRNLHRSVIKERLSARELGKPIQLGRGLAQIMRYSLSSSREFCMCRCRPSLRRSRGCWGAAGIFC